MARGTAAEPKERATFARSSATSACSAIAFFFPANHGEGDETGVAYIGMQGDHSHDRREAVDATYELVCQHSSVDVAAETQGTMGV